MDFTYIDPPETSTKTTGDSSRFQYVDQHQSEIKRDYPIRRALSKYVVHPVIEGGAMTLGGVAAAPLAPETLGIAPIAAAAAMYPPAHQAADAVDDMMGIGGRKMPAPPIGDQLLNSAKDFQTGMGIEAGGKVLRAVPGAYEKAIETGIPALLGPSKEAVTARLANPAMANAPSYVQQAEHLPVVLKNMGDVIGKLDTNAAQTLRSAPDINKGAVPLSFVNRLLGSLQDKLKVGDATVGSADQAASSRLGGLMNDIGEIVKQPKMPEIVGPTGQPLTLQPKEVYLPETTVKKLIQRIRQNIDFTDKSASSTNSVLTDVSGQLDAGLKNGNPAYTKAMKPVAKLTQLYNDTMDKFNLTKNTGEGLRPTDTTISSLKALPNERRGMSQKIAKRLQAVTGEDLVGASNNRKLADQFVGGSTNGSRRTGPGALIGSAVGTGVGALVGHPAMGGSVGTTLGTVAGMAADTTGREMGGKIIDSYVRAKPWLAKIPYEVAVRLISSGVLGNPEANGNSNGQ